MLREYLDLRKKEQENPGNCIIKNFINCDLHLLLLERFFIEHESAAANSTTPGKDEKCI